MSESHSGIFIPMSGLDHPLYDSVFANTASTAEHPDFPVPDERTLDTGSIHSNPSSVNGMPSSIIVSRQLDNFSQSDTNSGRLRTQANLVEAILYNNTMIVGSENGSHCQLPPPEAIYDDDSCSEGEAIPPPLLSDSMVYGNEVALEDDSVEPAPGNIGSSESHETSDAMDDDGNQTQSGFYNNTYTD